MMRLADIDNIVGVKLGSDYGYGELLRLHAYTAGKDFAIVCGGLHEFYLMCRSGIQTRASIGPLPQLAPEISSKYWETVVSGKWDEALVQLKEIYDFYWVVLNSPNFWGGFKYGLKLLGRDIGPCRLPTRMPNAAEQERIKTVLTKAGLLTPMAVAA
jgi:dihydrodipicolinate synthase/N-acetylneuraminate lyase